MEYVKPEVIADLQARLKRVEGQARGLQRMLDERRDCADVLTQLSAMRAAIGTIATVLLVENLEACIARGETDLSSNEAINRAKKLFSGFVK